MSRLLLVFVAMIIVALHVSNLVGDIPPEDFIIVSTISNLVKLEFNALDISGNNFMPWTLGIKAHIQSINLTETLNEPNNSSDVDRAKSLIFIRRHLCDSLKDEYLTVEDPKELWKNLIDRYGHQKKVRLPALRNQWNTLRFQYYTKVSDYNSVMYKLITRLYFCGVKITDGEMLEKTLSTFYAYHVTLQQQYRLQGFKKYADLIACLLIAEQNNNLLMKNHESCPTGSKIFPEANVVSLDEPKQKNYFQGRGKGCGRGRGHDRGCGRGGYNSPYKSDNHFHKKQQHGGNHEGTLKKGKEVDSSKGSGSTCSRCGSKGHWSRVCRVPEHLCKLYNESLKGKDKEVNFIDSIMDESTHLEASDFNNDFIDIVGDFDKLVDGGN
ncbi:hypothetical protein OROHE_013323 [Orobanche hederae]